MDKDRIEGGLDQAKAAVGKVIGEDKLQTQGAADKLATKAEEGVGAT